MPIHNHHGPVTVTKDGRIIIDGRQVGTTALTFGIPTDDDTNEEDK
ncbi:hypothetical protein [Streptosporangium lutulentum]|uniref:Uncharacterized protein n=1 Tax=Streptosporangium lutulentum TaxID=1461250 RepID=A0ABT9QMK6_9ACTN|nr:hypothetical protein [Streptosporangium lutulentum]MDP9847996.1 hypothetical protein [Streptosporangium lutulentum]